MGRPGEGLVRSISEERFYRGKSSGFSGGM